jgi:HTH-type transcriptional regulator/antitoxin HigA
MFLDTGNPAVGLTSRGDRMDGYVFTLLHELAHLDLGHLESGDIRTDEDLITSTDLTGAEAEANRKAASWILPEDLPLPAGRPSINAVLQLSARYRIHASFIIGRIQRDRKDWGLLRGSIPRVRPYVVVQS